MYKSTVMILVQLEQARREPQWFLSGGVAERFGKVVEVSREHGGLCILLDSGEAVKWRVPAEVADEVASAQRVWIDATPADVAFRAIIHTLRGMDNLQLDIVWSTAYNGDQRYIYLSVLTPALVRRPNNVNMLGFSKWLLPTYRVS